MGRRLEILRRIAQAAPGAAGVPVAAVAPAAASINIRAIPKFNAALFQNKPAMINDLNAIVNKINSYMSSLSGGKILFSSTWLAPSVSASQYPNAVRYLLTISKWLYSTLTLSMPPAQPYSLLGLNKLASDFIATVSSFPFSDPGASKIKEDLLSLGTIMLGKMSK
jgi:hypothetical protein